MAIFCENEIKIQNSLQRYRIWGIFDGHGGWDVALAGSRVFESAFRFSLKDAECAIDLRKDGIGLFWIANCGDSGATACSISLRSNTPMKEEEEEKVEEKDEESITITAANMNVVDVTEPHTIESERRRLQAVACRNPEYLGGAFARRMFEPPPGRRKWKGSFIPNKKDVGMETMAYDHFSNNLVKTTITKEDVIAEHSKSDKIVSSLLLLDLSLSTSLSLSLLIYNPPTHSHTHTGTENANDKW